MKNWTHKKQYGRRRYDRIPEDLTGVDNEEKFSLTNPWIIETMAAVAILVGILAWFGFKD